MLHSRALDNVVIRVANEVGGGQIKEKIRKDLSKWEKVAYLDPK
jgi:hypothetical protein